MKKRVLAGILAILLTASVVFDPVQQMVVQASEVSEAETVLDENIIKEEMQETENASEQVEETEKVEDSTEILETATEESEVTEVEETSETETEEETEGVEEQYYIQYLMLNSDKVSLNEAQKVVIGLDCKKEISDAVLKYHNVENGTEYTQKFADNADGALLFELIFQNEEQKGMYQLDKLTYKIGEQTYTELFAEAGIEASFGVETDVETDPDAYVENNTDENTDPDIDVVRIDEEGNVISEDSISEAIQNVSETATTAYSIQTADIRARKDIVVVLDPGHDNTHKGASANGLREEEINLKIASYCKAELENYSGIKVYMTRTSGSCPHPGTTSGVDNEERVKYAASVGADIYVSIHNNSSTSSSAHGAMVFYPNSNYNPSVGYTGKQLAQVIQKHLVALGLANRGITIRDAQNDKYPDGSKADYYGVIRNAKLAGIPAIIVEHAFLTNTGDANDFLKQEGKLKQMGIADAQAIVEYYNLGKTVNITSDGVKVANVNNDAGTALLSAWNVQPVDKVKKVSFAVWSKSNQSDLKWYDVNNSGSTTYAAEMNIKNHNYNTGTYYVDAYAEDIYGDSHYLGSQTVTFKMNVPKATVTVSANTTETQYTINASGVSVTGGISQVKVAVWSKTDGQDDLVWYPASKVTEGNYSAVVSIANHKTAGLYYADVYVYNTAGQSALAGETTFNVSDVTGGDVKITNQNDDKGQFDVVITNIQAKAGVGQVQVPVWSKKDQSDIYWYTATKLSENSYIVHADIKNHKYNYGTYNADVYVTTTTGIKKYIGGQNVAVKMPKSAISVTGNSDESQYIITAKNVSALDVKEVRAAVWSQNGGQDDLKWYSAKNTADGIWDISIDIKNHKTAGLYYADLYTVNTSGEKNYLGGTTFSVSEMTAKKVTVSNLDNGKGQFDVVISGIQAKATVKQIKVPVWSQKDQSDLYWYTATKTSNDTYTAHVNIANHKYNYGTYYTDVYGVTATEIQSYLGGTIVEVKVPQASVNTVSNKVGDSYAVTINNAGLAGGIKAMKVAVWSEPGGQDDLVWYTAADNGNGVWKTNISIPKHKTAGLYYAHVYATNSAGQSVFMCATSFEVSGITAKSVAVTNKNDDVGQFDVTVNGITAESGVDSIKIAVWSKDDQSDLYWYTATKESDSIYSTKVSLVNHKYNYGKYFADAYGYAKNGVSQYLGSTSVEVKRPKVQITAKGNANDTWYAITASNAGIAGSVKAVRAAVWSQKGGQDDLVWYDLSENSDSSWATSFQIARHKTDGLYYVDTYAITVDGSSLYLGGTTFTVSTPKINQVSITNYDEANGTFGVKYSGIYAPAGVNNIQVAVWSTASQSNLKWYTASKNSDGTYQIDVDIRNHQSVNGTYYADAYLTDNNGIKVYGGGITCQMNQVINNGTLHSIMGPTTTIVQQMVNYYNARATYPAYYATVNSEAPTIEAFCRIYVEECKAEGVRAEVAFCQAMKETGYLRYGGNVKIEQFNFAGIGSTGAGVAGASYPDVRTGIRAQIQHLKAYASTNSLNNACVDNRFSYVSRGSAPYVEWLGQKENPYGKGWATATNYGYYIVNMMNVLKTY